MDHLQVIIFCIKNYMKKIFLFLIFFCCLSFTNSNIIKNGGFEIDENKDNIPDNWKFLNSGGSEGIGIWDDKIFKNGAYGVKIEKKNEGGYSSWITNLKVNELTKYKISLWYKTENKHNYSQIGIYCRNEIGNIIGSFAINLEGVDDWKFFESIIETEKETKTIEIQLRDIGIGTSWFDDISLIETGYARIKPVSGQKEIIKISSEEEKEILKDAIYISKEINIGHQKTIKDETAKDGFCVRIDGDAPPYFAISWYPDINKIVPGLKYEIYARIKVNKIGEEETAFRIGVYDGINKKYVVSDMRPKSKDVKNMEWEIYKLGPFEFQKGQFVYVGPTKNVSNIREIFVDYLFIVPGDDDCKKFYKDGKEGIKFYLITEKEGSIGMKIKEEKICMGYYITEDKRVFEDSLVGVVIDYGKEKRVVFDLGICGDKIKKGERLFLGYGKEEIDEVLKIGEIGKYIKFDIDFKKYAPEKWDGYIWLTFINKHSLNTFSGCIIEPQKEKMNIFELKLNKEECDLVSIDIESQNYLRGKIENNNFKRSIEKLEKLQGETE